MEVVPRSLAENAGLDPIDKLAQLRSEHDKNRLNVGLNVITGEIQDMMALGVIEPLKIKVQAIKSAGEVAEMILRIDDIISSGSSGGPRAPPMPGGGMPEDY
jgi:chaperonin GroEL (HSP60 family)